MKVNKKTLSLVILFCLILVIGFQLIVAAIEVPLSPYSEYSNSNTDWWQYQFDNYPDYTNHNCGPACSAMLINYLKGKGVTTTYHASISSAYPEVHCYARWDYCKANGHSNGYDNSDWSSPGATTEQIISALSSENIQTHTFTGYDCCNDGRGITNLQNAIDQGKVCTCLVDPSYYRVTDCHSHWVVAYGYDDNYIYLNDPGYHTGQGFPASKSDFADALWHVTELSTVIVSDITIYNYPTVDNFSVTPTSIALGDSFNIFYTVSDDIGLQQTELWRVNDVGGEPGDWDTSYNPIFTEVLSGEKIYSGSFTDTPDTTGTYWYGMHVVDTSGNWSVEPKPPGPIVVTVTNPTLTIDISLEEVEICKSIQLIGSYNPNNISAKVKFKNIGEVIIDSFQIELYINGELKHVEKEDNKNLAPGTSGFSFFFWTLSEDICGDNIKMEIKITDVNPAESNANIENNSKTKILSIYYVPFNIKEDTYSFANPEFTDWLELKSTLDEAKSLMIVGLIYTPLGKLFKSKGYCYGMASTVVAYKEGLLTIPNGESVNDLEFTMPEVKKNILNYQINLSALGTQVHRMREQIWSNFPYISDEYQKIINSLKEGKLMMLALGESGTFKAHELVAYQCITDKETGTTFIYVYDSNYLESEKILELPLNTGIFGYEGYDMLWAEELKPLPADLIEEYFNDLVNLICDGLKSAGQELIGVFSSVNPFKNKNEIIEDTLITDEYGRKIGYLDGVPVNEIPDGVIEIFGNFQTYQIPLSLNYDIQIKGKEQGVFELHLTKPNPDDTMLNLIYEDVPTENNSEAFLTIGPSVTDFSIQLDQDGDGVVDEIKDPDFIEGVILLIGDFGSANGGPPDCIVDFEDLMIFALAYGATPSDSNWNLVCDIAGEGGVLELDGVIDFEDLMVFAMNYGKTCADL